VIRRVESLPSALLNAANYAGVSRLGAVTGLDRLGLPVWQAVRPCSRSISVHSGKGFTNQIAMSGALGEAIEAHASESWWKPDFEDDWASLPEASRSRSASDWWETAADHQQTSLSWTIVEPLAGKPLAIPTLAICNDFTRMRPEGLIASSSGQAAGRSRDDARIAGLLELVERDAFRAWQDSSSFERSTRQLTRSQIQDCQAGRMLHALAERGFAATFHALEAAVNIPVAVCILRDRHAGRDAPRVAIGSAARLDPGAALDAALLEAAQVRGTTISGSRDDMIDPLEADATSANVITIPIPPGMTTSARLPAPCVTGDPLSWLVEQLVDAGFVRVAAARLDEPTLGIPVEKLFVPGLLPMRGA
jgi:ribosomal protein S12 methylthiotransferase accessory factor